MNTKRTIRKILFVGLWLSIGTGMLLLLVAAIGKQKNETCKDVIITIDGAQEEKLFLQEKDIFKLVKAATNGPVKGQSRKRFDLWKIEKLIEGNMWVKDAQLYFDNKNILHVRVLQRQPTARVFTSGGRSFYLDESGQIMQLVDQLEVSLPVFTGFPEKKKLNASDSSLVYEMVELALFIQKNEFWNAQLAQIDLVSDGPTRWQFEMIPVVGNHTIRLGDTKDMHQKFNRLYQFYKQVLTRAGMEKYKIIDVRFAGQVVGERRTM